jgi:phosphate:Na+ symporter
MPPFFLLATVESPSPLSGTFTALGGLALFLLGMWIMTDGLRAFAGPNLRRILAWATRGRPGGYALGTGMGFVMHSSAASVMTVGFVNAGLLSLGAALPILYGLNLGTTLSMQLLSFRLTDLAYVFLAGGFVTQLIRSQGAVHHFGRAVMGFGILFLGMAVMGDVLSEFREELGPLLAGIDGSTWTGLLWGILIAAAVTGILQSSGAVIGMAFVMLEAGVLQSLHQAYPIILGAHIGTSVTALLGSVGTHLDARRTAVANLSFNVGNVILGALLAPWIIALMELTSSDPVHQAANAHTAVMLLAGVLLLPFCARHEAFIRRITPSAEKVPQSSFLDPSLLQRPEAALWATMRELQRSLRICRSSLDEVIRLITHWDPKRARRGGLNEQSVNEIKDAVEDYLDALTGRYLSRRQALMLQYLARGNANIERIGDHLDSILDWQRRRRSGHDPLGEEACASLVEVAREGATVLDALLEGLSPGTESYAEAAAIILERRDRFSELAQQEQTRFNERVAAHQEDARAGLFYNEAVLALVRMIRHAKVIALEMQQPFFAVKPSKLERTETRPPRVQRSHPFN